MTKPPISRAAMEQLMFGAGKVRRFTQDTPVLPDVWLRFAGVPTDDEDEKRTFGEPLKVLIAPYREAPAGKVRNALAERLAAARGTSEWKALAKKRADRPRLIYNQSTVAATISFADLVRVVLPMTEWWRTKVAKHTEPGSFAKTAVRNYIADAVKDPEHPPKNPNITLGPDVLWLVRVVGALAMAYGAKPVPARLKSDKPDLRKDKVPQKFWRDLADAALDAIAGLESVPPPDAKIHSVSANRRAGPTVSGSILAVKADAARRVFEINCSELAWAVVDSGIDATHPAFRKRNFDPEKDRSPTRIRGTFDFTSIELLLDPDAGMEDLPPGVKKRVQAARAAAKKSKILDDEFDHLKTSLRLGHSIDWKLIQRFIEIPMNEYSVDDIPLNDHGTHVAGVLAADWRVDDKGKPSENLVGVCPDLNLYDFRVLGPDGSGDEFNVMAALQFVRFLNTTNDVLAVHGVNLSMSIPHDVTNFACGRTPICDEAERVVNSGIVVVAAAGNQGYRKFTTPDGTIESFSSISITDPGNADLVITVGATHRTRPHTYGVSYFSSRGPTGDGRSKPDLVAPGEKIASPLPHQSEGTKDGTSQAAPHVSGAAALLMARHNELVGRPMRIKEVLCSTATDLGRERYFQGAGMLDVLRALQAV